MEVRIFQVRSGHVYSKRNCYFCLVQLIFGSMTVFTYTYTYAVGKRETAATTQIIEVLETTELTLRQKGYKKGVAD